MNRLDATTEFEERTRAARVAAGEDPPDLVVRNGRVVDVFSGRVRRADVVVSGNRIALVGPDARAGPRDIDCGGAFVLPGFVEPHLHIGGSQLAIEGLAEVLVSRGTVALSTCFYEPAFIAGVDAALELVERARGTGLDVLLSPFHAAVLGIGQFGNLERFGFDDLERMLDHPACVELREWSYLVGKIPLPGIERVYRVALERGVAIGGHLEGLPANLVQASAALGARSDHETARVDEAVERIAAGVTVQAREGSGARDLLELIRAITEDGADARSFSFSTDEQELASLVVDGHIDHKLRLAVANGVPPVEAVRMATFNAALSMGVHLSYGAVAPGRYASLVVVEDLSAFRVRTVISRGEIFVEDGEYVRPSAGAAYASAWRETVRVTEPLDPAGFRLDAPAGEATVRVIGVTPGSLVTEELVEHVRVEDGRLTAPDGLAKISVIDRHEGGSRRMTGLIRGLGVTRGAIAATVNPGMMNLMVVGADERDMAVAANRVVELGGGIAVAADGAVVADVALPLLGILSDAPVPEVSERCISIDRAVRDALGSPVDGLITSAGFACLAVSIPRLKICDRALVRVHRDRNELVDFVVASE